MKNISYALLGVLYLWLLSCTHDPAPVSSSVLTNVTHTASSFSVGHNTTTVHTASDSAHAPLAPVAPGEDASPIILILDGSGSMWGKIESQTKIEIAREVVSELLDDMDPLRPVGLLAYGHRSKSDCADIEYLHQPAVDNRSDIKTTLHSINPVGKTPLADAALLVIEHLKQTGEQASIILVSDGAESCGGDLCAVIKAAKEAGLDFVLHIIGFDIGESDKTALECAARAGEGLYLDAGSSEELSSALQQTSELTVEETAATLGVKVMKDGKLHDALVKVYPSGETEKMASLRSYYHETSNPVLFHIPAGTYDIEVTPLATDLKPAWRKDVVVSEEEIRMVEVDFAPGTLSILATNNGELWDCTTKVIPAGEPQARPVAGGRTYNSPSSNPQIDILDPGVYDVLLTATRLKGDGYQARIENIVVKPGETTHVTHDFKSGKAIISATHEGQFWDCTVSFKQNGKNVTGGRTYAAGPKEFLITPGTYEVVMRPLRLDAAEQTFTVTIRAGETTEKQLTF